jgi:hypothetical protein
LFKGSIYCRKWIHVTIESRLKDLLAFFGDMPLGEIEEAADKYKLGRRSR